jgi:hypothetical protein
MRCTLRRFQAFLGLEFESTFRFPIIEGLICFLVFLQFSGATMVKPELGFRGSTDESLNITDIALQNSESIEARTTSLVAGAFNGVTLVLVFILPMLVAFTLALGFENGSFRTYFSYPINRSFLLISRMLILILVTGLAVTLSSLSAIYFLLPMVLQSESIFLLILGLWTFIILVTSGSTLISIISQRALSTAVVGIGVWYSLVVLLNFDEIPRLIRSIVNPLTAAIIPYVSGNTVVTYGDVILALLGTSIVGIVFLCISLVLFDHAEI